MLRPSVNRARHRPLGVVPARQREATDAIEVSRDVQVVDAGCHIGEQNRSSQQDDHIYHRFVVSVVLP